MKLSQSLRLDLITKMPLFGKSSKSPVELVRVLKESLLVLEKGGDGKKQANTFTKYCDVKKDSNTEQTDYSYSELVLRTPD